MDIMDIIDKVNGADALVEDASKTQLSACAPKSDDERIDLVAERILHEYLDAFKELAR